MLFLFDIDGTLLRGMPPLHRMALCDAALRVYDARLTPTELGQTAGMTDRLIISRSLRLTGISEATINANLSLFWREAAAAYEERLAVLDLRPYHTPYAQSTLDWLRAAGAFLGLVTGNMQSIAWAKLDAAQLSEYFIAGGFGDEAEERERLPPLALARMEEGCSRSFHSEPIFVIGDTPDDVRCGAACGLSTIAVATGPTHAREELQAAGANYVIDDLSELASLPLLAGTSVLL
ncbi:MAG: HAD family hydrolase [Ktedonobacterales bacterium]